MENEKTKNPVGATIGETQNIIQIRASLEVMERNLPKEEALMLAKRIRPVMTRTANGKFKMLLADKKLDGDKHWVDGGKIYNQSYTFNDLRQIYEKAESLTEVATINTYHRCGYPALLKPSVYEVLYQIPQDLLDKFAKLTMLGRLGQPIEIANAALFLACEESSYVTGQVLEVNGGMRL